MQIMPEKKYNMKSIAEVMGVNKYTIYRWYNQGKIALHINPLNNYFWMWGKELLTLYQMTYGEPYEAATSSSGK